MTTGFVTRFKGKILASGASLGVFGKGAAPFGFSGNLYSLASAGVNPGVINGDNVLASFFVPASVFDVAGRVLTITAGGSFAANVHSKDCKIFVGSASATVGSTIGASGTNVADTGAYTTNSNVGWLIQAQIVKYGAAASNTQTAQELATIIGGTHGGCGVPQALTLTESAGFWVACTGDAVTTLTDIILNTFEVNAQN